MEQLPPGSNPVADAKLWVAIAALVQPWLIGLWNRFIRRGRLRVYPTANIEVGFSTFGPTIGRRGTVHATRQDVFIKSARLLVTRVKDHAELRLNWFVTRPTTINLDGPQPSTAELAASFLLKKSDPAVYNVVFSQSEFSTDHAAPFQAFTKEWNEYVSKHPANAQTSTAARYEEFRKQTTSATQVWSDLNNTFFWHAGEYRLRFSIAVEKPAAEMNRDWTFSLTEEDVSSLRLNVVSVLEQAAGLPVSWNFAYPKYAEPVAIEKQGLLRAGANTK